MVHVTSHSARKDDPYHPRLTGERRCLCDPQCDVESAVVVDGGNVGRLYVLQIGVAKGARPHYCSHDCHIARSLVPYNVQVALARGCRLLSAAPCTHASQGSAKVRQMRYCWSGQGSENSLVEHCHVRQVPSGRGGRDLIQDLLYPVSLTGNVRQKTVMSVAVCGIKVPDAQPRRERCRRA